MKILVAEDTQTARKLALKFLTKWGYDVVTANDGVEAWETFQQDKSIQVALLDWMMPRMDGIELCKLIKSAEDRPFTYVIMLTAMSQKTDLVVAFGAGADDYVTKPFNSSELRVRINAGERILNLQQSLNHKVKELESALEEVHILRGFVPICAWCRKVRSDDDYWESIEEYFETHSLVQFTHGMCPDCSSKQKAEKALADKA